MRKSWLFAIILTTLFLLRPLVLSKGDENTSLWNIVLKVSFLERKDNEYVPFGNRAINMNIDHEQFVIEVDEKGVVVLHMKRRTTSDYLLRRFRIYSISFPELVFLEKIEGDIPYYYRSWVIGKIEDGIIHYQIKASLVPKIIKIDRENYTCFYSLKIYVVRARIYSFICLNPFTLSNDAYIYSYNWIPIIHTNKICLPEDVNIITFSVRFNVRIDSARGIIYRRYIMTHSILLSDILSNEVIDATPTMIVSVHSLILREANDVKKKLTSFGLWSEDLEEQHKTLLTILNSSREHCLEGNYVLSAYENKVALRILKGLQESGKLVNVISNYFITPLLLLAIAFFSYFTARVISERKWNLLALLLFIITTLVFTKANSYFSLYLTTIKTPLFAEPPEMRTFRVGLLVFIIALFLALLHPKVSSRLSILELTIRNICSRRRRFVLALLVVSLISSATVTHLKTQCKRVLIEEKVTHISAVDSGLTVKKLKVNYLYGQDISARQINLSYEEALWLLSFSNTSSCLGSARVKLLINNNEVVCDAAICNTSYLAEFCNLTKFLTYYDSSLLSHGVLLSDELVERIKVRVNDKVKAFGIEFPIAGYFTKSKLNNLVDIDGEKLFESNVDVIFPQRHDILKAFYLRKVSIIFSHNVTPSLEELARYIEAIGLDLYKFFDPSAYGGRGAVRIVGFTYNINLVRRSSIVGTMMLHEEFTVLGAWELQLVLIAMGALIVFITAMGNVYERKIEAQTISSLGASPSVIFAMFSLEGLVVGLVGGMLGFFIGFAFSLITNAIFESLPLSTLGITEFFLLLIIGSITSATGYIIPTVRASLLVVPSRRYLIKAASEEELSKVIKRTKRELVVQLPFKFLPDEERLLDRFLSEEFVRIQTSRMYGITLTGFRKEVKNNVVSFIYDVSYKSPWHGLPISLTILVNLKRDNVLTPVISIKSNFDLGLIRSDVKDLISSIREGLLYYIDWKRSIKTT